MYTFREKRDKIVGQDLDEYLAKGWYRMGNTIFTCQFLLQNRNLFSATWIRLDLDGYAFNKRNRKTMSRNGRMFTYKIAKAEITDEKEALYQKYRKNFDGYISEDIISNLHEGHYREVFDTWNIEVYHENKLVALSFFDKGDISLASILGIYDPDYSKYSLGYYTLLLEVQTAQKLGMRYFYPGYIVHDNPRFDYKEKIGDVEYYDFLDSKWVDKDTFYQKEIMVDKLMNRLFDLNAHLRLRNIENGVFLYPYYEASMFYFDLENYLKHPVYLEIGKTSELSSSDMVQDRVFVVFDLLQDTYQVLICKRLIDMDVYSDLMHFSFQNLLMVDDFIFESNDVEEVVLFLSRN